MAEAAARSKAVVLLLLIHCLMHLPLFVGVLCLSLFCYALLCVHSSFVIILKRKKKASCFAGIVLQVYCCYMYKCSVAIPHIELGWSAVCHCGIS